MPTTISPTDPQASGWRAFANALQNHANLRGVKTWRMWGAPADPEEPSSGQLIWCRITPIALPAEAQASRGPSLPRTYRCPLELDIELAVPGPDPSALISLWGRFESAIFPADSAERLAFRTSLAAHGIRDIRLLQRAAPTSTDMVTTAMVTGTGSVALDFWIDV